MESPAPDGKGIFGNLLNRMNIRDVIILMALLGWGGSDVLEKVNVWPSAQVEAIEKQTDRLSDGLERVAVQFDSLASAIELEQLRAVASRQVLQAQLDSLAYKQRQLQKTQELGFANLDGYLRGRTERLEEEGN